MGAEGDGREVMGPLLVRVKDWVDNARDAPFTHFDLQHPVICTEGWITARNDLNLHGLTSGYATNCMVHERCYVHPLLDEALLSVWRLAGWDGILTTTKRRSVANGRWPQHWNRKAQMRWSDRIEGLIALYLRKRAYG